MRLLLLIVKIITAICLVALPATVLIRTWKFRVCRTKKEHHIIRAILVAWTVTGLLAAILVCGVPLNSFLRHKKLCALSTENEELTLLNSNLEAELIHKGNKHDQLIKGGKIYLYDGTSINIRRNSGRETIIFKQLLNLRKKKNFKSLAYTSNLQIKRNPDWLTPYFFLGIANIEMGQTNKAIENLRHVCDNTPFDPSYRQAHDLLKHITTNNTPPFSYPSR